MGIRGGGVGGGGGGVREGMGTQANMGEKIKAKEVTMILTIKTTVSIQWEQGSFTGMLGRRRRWQTKGRTGE